MNELVREDVVCYYLHKLSKAFCLKLRKICLYKISSCTNFLRKIEVFKQLNELLVERVIRAHLDLLRSPSLQTISFKSVERFSRVTYPGPLKLETPNLTRFVFWNKLEFPHNEPQNGECLLSYPDRLVYLECTKLSYPKIANLQHLICQEIDDDVDFRNYPKLRKLEYYPVEYVESMRRIENLKEHRKRYNPNLEIFVSGSKLDSNCESPIFFKLIDREFSLFSVNKDDDLAIFSKCFGKPTNQFPWRFKVNYLAWLTSFGSQTACCFFQIFPSIYSVVVHGPPAPALDANKLIDFLNECRSLECLKLVNCPSDLYRSLATIKPASYITRLEIKQSEAVEFELTNYVNLKDFVIIGSRLSLQTLNDILKQSHFISQFHFVYRAKNSDLNISVNWGSSFLFISNGDYFKRHSIQDRKKVIDFLRDHEQTKDYLV